jgi:hypothetical protein
MEPTSLLVPKWMSTAAWMIVLCAIGFGVWCLSKVSHAPLSPVMVIVLALASAFVWVEKLRLGTVKPFTCCSCLTGWFALILAWWSHADYWFLYLPLGVFVGSMWEAVKMRYL